MAKGVEIVEDQAYFAGSTADLQKALAAGALDRCGSLVVERKLTALPPEIGRLRRLRELRLETDTLQTIDPALFQCVGLVALFIGSNQLKALPAGGWARLKELRLLTLSSSNALRSLPDDLGDAPQLGGEFELGALSKLAALPASFARLQHVTLLRLPPGLLAPEPIAGMKGLRELRVQGVDHLPDDLGALAELRFLDAADCAIAALPASLGAARALHTLSLARTRLTALPESLGELPALRNLDLEGTPLEALPEALGQAPLQHVRLQGTVITRLPASFAQLAGDLRIFLPREQRAAIEASSASVLAALGSRARFE